MSIEVEDNCVAEAWRAEIRYVHLLTYCRLPRDKRKPISAAAQGTYLTSGFEGEHLFTNYVHYDSITVCITSAQVEGSAVILEIRSPSSAEGCVLLPADCSRAKKHHVIIIFLNYSYELTQLFV